MKSVIIVVSNVDVMIIPDGQQVLMAQNTVKPAQTKRKRCIIALAALDEIQKENPKQSCTLRILNICDTPLE
ncbi:hypothetical protein OS493_021011 [Desmophyllum pertusum]|uniref:Uncharacterized protein n=1 Tax=Desmophyllum pertusum TaxID=174260 RepID=A0A9X0A020_9CNID|nr:hypothetical protein OS493_021011 [Desmophyllum pertusum]